MSSLNLSSDRKNKGQKDRKKRIPVGAQRIKGAVDNLDPRYQYRWVSDTPGRLGRFLDGGYEMVLKDGVTIGSHDDKNSNLGSMVSQYAGRDPAGLAYNRYLMRIRNEFYNEDFETKQALVDETDRAIRAGKFKRGAHAEAEYVPASGITISSSSRVPT